MIPGEKYDVTNLIMAPKSAFHHIRFKNGISAIGQKAWCDKGLFPA